MYNIGSLRKFYFCIAGQMYRVKYSDGKQAMRKWDRIKELE